MSEKIKVSLEELLMSKSIIDFTKTATDFCFLIEKRQSDCPKEFLEILQKQLLTLYIIGLNLPDIDIENDVAFETKITKEQTQMVLDFIGERVPFSYYWTIINPLDVPNIAETGAGDLTDDLLDIYIDLKMALIQFESKSSASKRDAIWQFKFDFDNHWGEHCINSIHIISHYLFDNR